MITALQSAALLIGQSTYWMPGTLLIVIRSSSGNNVSAPEALKRVIQDELGPLFPAGTAIEWAIENGYFISRKICEMHGVTAATDVHPRNTLSTVTKPPAAKVEAVPVRNQNIEVWRENAVRIGKEILKKAPGLSVEKIAKKTHDEMTSRNKKGDAGMTGRGGKVPSADTIKRHALTGIKA